MKAYIALVSALLTACNANIEPSDDYQKRVQVVLGTKIELFKENKPLVYPRMRLLDRQQGNTKNSLSIREFLSLRECKLHVVIAQRNSIIGKVAPASQLLFNDLKILQHAPNCINKLLEINNVSMAKKIASFEELKKKLIINSLWNAILGEHENTLFWHSQKQPKDYPKSLNIQSIESIKALLVFVEKVKQKEVVFSKQETSQIEQHLKVLKSGDGGYLLSKLMELDNHLQKANTAIKMRLEKPLCLRSKPTEKAIFFKNVVTKYFIDKVQVRAVELTQRYHQLMPDYIRLELALKKGEPPAYKQWRTQRDKQLLMSLNSSKKHVQQVQLLFSQCGLNAGR